MTRRDYVVRKIHPCIKFEFTTELSTRKIDTKIRSFFYKKKPTAIFYFNFFNKFHFAVERFPSEPADKIRNPYQKRVFQTTNRYFLWTNSQKKF